MAARKEIIDFIEWERKNPEASNDEELFEQLLKVVEIYSERKADTVTLVNDLLDLLCSCRQREMHNPKTAFDYELVITSLIQSATDWNVILTEDEIKRFENVKVCDIKNLAEHIRTTYKHTNGKTTGDEAFPDILTTDEQKQAWKKAIKNGFMEPTSNGFKWKLNPACTLAYFCGKLFGYKRANNNGVLQNVGGQVPYDILESMFNVTRLDRALSQLYDAKKPQAWRKQIDKLFE